VYDWFRGINLKTWLHFNGQTPDRNKIVRYLERNRPVVHGDIAVYNVVLQGDDAVFIDVLDGRREILDDEEMFNKLLLELK
jgi:serine/threonine-protein kinase RIO1